MKMKTTIAAFAAIALLASCSTSESDVNKQGGNETKSPTYASFSFNLGTKTRALADFNPTPQTEATANEKLIGTGDLYILVFNATTKALEYKAPVTGSTHTALLTAGQKKIFVLANIGAPATTTNVQANLKTVDLATLATSTTAAPYASLVVGTSTTDDLYKIAFDAGTPQAFDVTKSGARTFSVAPLYTVIDAGTLGLPMSNNNSATFTLNANITQDQANTAGTPAETGSEANNRFKITLDYMGAKARLVLPTTANQTIADISAPKYTVKNLAKYTSLVQSVVAGVPQSIYHNMTYGSNPTITTFQTFFDQASTVNVNVAAAAVPATPFIYVPENTNSNLLRGQSSFFELNVTYKPKNVVKTIAFAPLTNTVTYTYDTYANLVTAGGILGGTAGSETYVYVTAAINGLDPANVFFATSRLLADAVWMSQNQKDKSDATYSVATADALVAGKFKTYTNAQSWYRMDIGEGSGTSTVYGVFRGKAYTATVNKITGPGEPTEEDLFTKPEDPVSARTYINVTIEARGWVSVDQNGDL